MLIGISYKQNAWMRTILIRIAMEYLLFFSNICILYTVCLCFSELLMINMAIASKTYRCFFMTLLCIALSFLLSLFLALSLCFLLISVYMYVYINLSVLRNFFWYHFSFLAQLLLRDFFSYVHHARCSWVLATRVRQWILGCCVKIKIFNLFLLKISNY